jgi:hypothetical protein
VGTPYEIAWAAGFFEGEGTISLRTLRTAGNRYGQVSLEVTSTDLDVLERFATVVGVGNIKPKANKANLLQRKQQYMWRVGSRPHTERILTAFKPWLGVRRVEKCDEALTWLRDHKESGRL